MARSSIGLDVGSKAVRVAEVRYGGGRPSLTRYGRALLPAGAVEHGEVQEPAVVASAISRLWKELDLKDRAVHVGISNRHCVVRVVELPVMSRGDLESAIRFQAQEHIPISLDEAVMEFEVLEELDGPDGRIQRILVVAAERAAIDPLLAALSAARLQPQSLELNAYPLVRCFNGHTSGAAHAIVDVGGAVTNVVIYYDGKIRFSRILPNFGGEDFTAAIAEGIGVPRDQAEKLKRKVSKDAGSPAAAVVDRLLDRFVNEVRGSIEFFTLQSDRPLSDVVLTGGGSLISGLAERLGAVLGVPVEHGRPFEHVPVDRKGVSDKEMSIAEPFLGVAVGLALAENGG